jgi:serine/threonine protein phosphatase PrpC
LHSLHEKWLKKERNQVEDTSEEALDAAWTGSGKWIAWGECPAAKEKPFHIRKFKTAPADSSTEAVFRNSGCIAVNTKGQKALGETTQGQDNCSVAALPDWQLLCVMDGHGPGGHWPASRAVRTVPFFLQGSSCSMMLKQGNVEAALRHAFQKAEADLEFRAFKENVDIQVAGSTAVCCCFSPKKGVVWVATCGDSRVILIVPGKGAVEQTTDHKPSHPEEKERVERLGCDVLITTYEDGWVEERINVAGRDYPGISMTRSFGDLLVKDHGVSAEPEVRKWDINGYKETPYLFAASDGVWEFLDTKQVAEDLLEGIKENPRDLKEACHKLLKKAREKWRETEGVYCDDISMVLMPLIKSSDKPADGCCAGITKSCSVM